MTGTEPVVDVELNDVTKTFGDFVAVDHVDLQIRKGEFFSILGPSGCGKTTILRLISGFLQPSSGSIAIAGKPMAGVKPEQRPSLLIFQSLALFPMMNVAENIEFGLAVRGVPKAERARRVEHLLNLIALPDVGGRSIAELSGGQKQRIAIARALALEPAVLLLDEPLSALDLKLREHMRLELRDLQRRTSITFIYITHDQSEALLMSDRVAVMQNGIVEQIATPAEIYDRPATPFVATFVGATNAVPGTVLGIDGAVAVLDTPHGRLAGLATGRLQPGAAATLFVRPERITIGATAGRSGPSNRNRIAARLLQENFEGGHITWTFGTEAGTVLLMELLNTNRQPAPDPGRPCRLEFRTEDAIVLAGSSPAADAGARPQ